MPPTETPSTTTQASSSSAIFVVPGSLDELSDTHFYDHPWPSDLRRDADGSIVFRGFYDPRVVPILQSFITASKGLLKGFSPAAVTYLRFTGDLDTNTLPSDPANAARDDASVQIVDVDPASPERGKRALAQLSWRKNPGTYVLENTLAVMPLTGSPLRPATRYAVVVTNRVHAADGTPVAPSADLEEVLGVREVSTRARAAHDLYAPAIAELEKVGVPTKDIAHLAVFTTNDPTAELFAVADDVHKSVPAPKAAAAAWVAKEQSAAYDVYEGTYGPSPNYQIGTVPFTSDGDGGGFVFDAAGKPKIQDNFDLRFSLVTPNKTQCPEPPSGYPIMLYAHGTGGDYRSVLEVADVLAANCIASMGVDQIFHGTRPGATPGFEQFLFFNLNNPTAARTNNRQSAIDVVQQARLFTETHMTVPAAISRTGADVHFDGKKVVFVGHSQGGLNGPLFLAADNAALGAVLSGAGSMVSITLLEKTEPTPSVAGLVKSSLNLDDEAELTIFHPAISLAQTLIDVSDPLHYMRYVIRSPRSGFAPKSVLQTEGVKPNGQGDSYAPPHGIEAGALALGLPRMAPGIRPIAEAQYTGLVDATIPADGLSGNLAGGKASGVLAQFAPAPESDGHFVLFEVPAAKTLAAGFCRGLIDDPKGRVPAVK